MTTDTFSWCVRIGAAETITVSTIQAQFGDGYKQVAENGINSRTESWNLSCNGAVDDMKKIRAFLKEHVAKSFWWENAWGEKKLYRTKADSIAPSFVNGQFVEIAFVFEEAFSP